MGWGALISGAVSLGAGLLGASSSDKANKRAQQKREKLNKRLYEWQAKQIKWKQDLDKKEIERKAINIVGAQRAGYAAAGVKGHGAAGESSGDLVVRDTLRMAARDLNVIKTQANFDIKMARDRYKLGVAAQTTTKSFGSTLLTAGSQFVAGGFGTGAGGWYGIKF